MAPTRCGSCTTGRREVLVLDANLPDMNGYEVLARLRALPALAQVPAFMCSADAMPEDLQRARDAGFQGYWTKPIEMGGGERGTRRAATFAAGLSPAAAARR